MEGEMKLQNEKNDENLKFKYKRLKRKYNLLFQEYDKIVNEYEKSISEIQENQQEKHFLKKKIKKLLELQGIDITQQNKH